MLKNQEIKILKSRKGVLWDMDGTLVDSEDEHYITWHDVLEPLGVNLSRSQFKDMLGMRNDLIVARLLGDSVPEHEVMDLGLRKEEAYRVMVRSNGVRVLPGGPDIMRKLNQAGWAQFVASSAPRKNIEVIVESCGFSDYVRGFVSADEVERGKPYPDLFIEAAVRFGLPPSACIVVEDAHVGVEAARKAGMKTIAVRTTHPDVEADVVVDGLDDLRVEDFRKLLGSDTRERSD